jgi:hypothetical protein
MGLFDSLLGGGRSSTETAGSTTGTRKGTTRTERESGFGNLPPELQEILTGSFPGLGEIFSGSRTPTRRAAGASPLQEQGFGAAGSNVDFANQFLGPAGDAFRTDLARGIDPNQFEGFQQALQSTLDPIREGFDRSLRDARLRASTFGGAGGANEANVANQLAQDFARETSGAAGRLTLPLSSQLLSQRGDLIRAAPGLAQAQLPGIEQMLRAGGEQRNIEQAGLDAAFETERARGIEDPLRAFQAMLGGAGTIGGLAPRSTTTTEDIRTTGTQKGTSDTDRRQSGLEQALGLSRLFGPIGEFAGGLRGSGGPDLSVGSTGGFGNEDFIARLRSLLSPQASTGIGAFL